MTSKEKYTKSIMDACNEMRLDYFPQVEASELLYRVITLEDIYLPLSLGTSSYDVPSSGSDFSSVDIDELIRRIDEKIAALEAEEARKNANNHDEDNAGEIIGIPEMQSQDLETPIDTGLRLLLEANPGGGKTTFCKRLVLAMLNNEEPFFMKYAEENDLFFKSESLPVLISCKNIADLSAGELASLNFIQLMYKLCVQSFGQHFAEISEDEFTELVESYESNQLCIILDGWDEILDAEKEQAFCENLNNFLEQNPSADTIITIRVSYVAPELFQPYSARMIIRPLSDNDIREFCKKWYEIILSPNQQRTKNYSLISEQILSSKDQQVRAMMKNPLDLSLLLTVSKNDGRLPENKAELFKELVDLYIFWSTNKSTGSLSAKSIRVFLAYIASIFTKNKKLYCAEDELLHLIKQAITDLEWTFSEDITCFDPHNIAKELSHTGILTRTYDGKRFSFSESTRGTHRQMQEYLTAYAIVAQYSDEEYNNMQPIEIFEDKYGIRQWREVILFVALMNNGRLRQDLIRRLILKAEEKPDDNYVYTNLLFDLIVNGADIRLADKHRIYDIIFSKHITDQQIANIIALVTNNNRGSADFITYIHEMFAESVNNGDSEYGYAQAVIEAAVALQQGKTPFAHAEALMRTDMDVSIVAGSQILLILSWCKYANIVNAFSSYSSQYKMPSEWIELYKIHIKAKRVKTHLLKSIREAFLADFASFNDFFSVSDVIDSCLHINVPEDTENCELILSIAPVFDSSFHQSIDIDSGIKKKYLQKLKDEIEHKEYDEIVFSFSICAMLGCFTSAEIEEKWDEIDDIYKNLKDDGYIGKARYMQLKKSLRPKELSSILEQLDLRQNLSPQNNELISSASYWEVKEWRDSYAIFSTDTKRIRITFPASGLSEDAQGFLSSIFSVSVTTNNNLAYLLRRHEIETITTGADFSVSIMPEQLLEEGIRLFDEFSVINYALSIADICANERGNYAVGKDYLASIKASLHSEPQYWTSVFAWWSNLSLQRNEYEGIVVLTWLFTLEFLDVYSIDRQTLVALSSKLQVVSSISEDFVLFNKAILARIE